MAMNLKQLHAILRGNYGTKWDEFTDAAAKVGLTRMMEEFGPERTHQAVLKCIETEQFFEIANLRKHVPQINAVRQTCPMCAEHNGMVAKTADGQIVKYADTWNMKPGSFTMTLCRHAG